MKPFDLQAAINGAPIQASDGTSLKFITHVKEAVFHERIITLDPFGSILLYCENDDELVMSPVFKTYWANVDRSEYGQVSVGRAMLDEKAVQLERSYLPRCIKTISFEVEE
jgi:hypothetical protein